MYIALHYCPLYIIWKDTFRMAFILNEYVLSETIFFLFLFFFFFFFFIYLFFYFFFFNFILFYFILFFYFIFFFFFVIFYVSAICFQICTIKLILRPKMCLTYAISIVN